MKTTLWTAVLILMSIEALSIANPDSARAQPPESRISHAEGKIERMEDRISLAVERIARLEESVGNINKLVIGTLSGIILLLAERAIQHTRGRARDGNE